MSLIKKTYIYIFCAVLLCILINIDVYAGDPLIEGIKIEDNYKTSSQAKAGNIQEVTGRVIIIHADNDKIGYMAGAGFDIYEKDTIISQPGGHIRFKMNDGSILSAASDTKLVISRSIYEPQEKTRDYFLNMLIGKAHFLVKKISGYKSRFEVKTKTAVVGVRGSEFIIESQISTKVTTLENTILWVENFNFPDQGIQVGSFMQTIIGEGMLPTIPEPVSSDEIKQITQDVLPVIPKKDEISLEPEPGTGEINVEIQETLLVEEPKIDIEEPEMTMDISDIVEDINDMIQDDIPSDVTHETIHPYDPDQELSGGSGTGGP
ncbi:FecR domain-containing protein [Desulfonema limicola]|uniref:FecR domain-containing protein n=1 Tax=Desulfonema limicola TaxID=45656 RepID=A0A975BAV1_9BACT|nr:FecR family protein [Desulfonema limicola]QTA82219.1 FecR domain-containing protein [Desulfonema limicola]